MKGVCLVLFAITIGYASGYGAPGRKGNPATTSFRAKYGLHQNVDSYFQLPKNTQEANTLGFRAVPYTPDHGYVLTLMCSNRGLQVCALFDSAGSVAGMQIAIPRADVENTATDIRRRLKLRTIQGREYWTASIYFASPGTIKNGGRRGPVAETVEGLWVENGNELINVPLTERDLTAKTPFKKQNCYPGMGTHFYYNVSPQMNCNDWLPYFVLVKQGKVIGIGFSINGRTSDPTQTWLETVPAEAATATIPDAPACITDRARKYGIIQLHTYFVDNPWAITCGPGDNVRN